MNKSIHKIMTASLFTLMLTVFPQYKSEAINFHRNHKVDVNANCSRSGNNVHCKSKCHTHHGKLECKAD